MKKSALHIKTLIIALCATLLLTAAPCFAKSGNSGKALPAHKSATLPVIKLKHWKESTPNERYAFLSGFISMLELEGEWQGKNTLAFKQSLVSSWKEGFKGLTLKDIYEGINAYMAVNPADMERPVVEVMWFKFVQPKVTDKLEKRK